MMITIALTYFFIIDLIVIENITMCMFDIMIRRNRIRLVQSKREYHRQERELWKNFVKLAERIEQKRKKTLEDHVNRFPN